MSNRRMTSEEMQQAARARCSEILSDPETGFHEFSFHSDKVGDGEWVNRLIVKGANFSLNLMVWPPEEADGE